MTFALILANWQAALASVIGITASLGAIWRWLTKKVIPFWVNHFENVDKLVSIAPDLEKLSEQFKPNGGSSVKDSLDRLEAYTVVLAKQNDEHKAQLKDVSKDIVAIKVDVAELKGKVFR